MRVQVGSFDLFERFFPCLLKGPISLPKGVLAPKSEKKSVILPPSRTFLYQNWKIIKGTASNLNLHLPANESFAASLKELLASNTSTRN